MKKFLNILIYSCCVVLIMSGNPNHEILKADPGLQPYENILHFSANLPAQQKNIILQWIKNDQVINLRVKYYRSLTNYKP